MTGRIRGDADDIIFLKFDPLLPLSNSQVPDHNPMALLLRIRRNIEKAKRREENPCRFQGSRRSRIDQKDVHRKTSPGITWRSKFQITNSKSQINSNLQYPMIETDSASNLEFDSLELICYLACLREAPPCGTKAGAWDLVLILNTMARSQ